MRVSYGLEREVKGRNNMLEKLIEHTYGTHIYMKMRLDDKRIEEIDVYLRNNGEHYYVTSADHGMELCSGESLKQKQNLRQKNYRCV